MAEENSSEIRIDLFHFLTANLGKSEDELLELMKKMEPQPVVFKFDSLAVSILCNEKSTFTANFIFKILESIDRSIVAEPSDDLLLFSYAFLEKYFRREGFSDAQKKQLVQFFQERLDNKFWEYYNNNPDQLYGLLFRLKNDTQTANLILDNVLLDKLSDTQFQSILFELNIDVALSLVNCMNRSADLSNKFEQSEVFHLCLKLLENVTENTDTTIMGLISKYGNPLEDAQYQEGASLQDQWRILVGGVLKNEELLPQFQLHLTQTKTQQNSFNKLKNSESKGATGHQKNKVLEKFQQQWKASTSTAGSDHDYTEERQAAVKVVQDAIEQNHKNFKLAIGLSFLGFLIPIISHIIIWAVYFATRQETATVVVDKDQYLKLRGKTSAWLTERLKVKSAVRDDKKDYIKEGAGSTRFRKVIVESSGGADAEGKSPRTLSLLFLNQAQAAHCVAQIKELEQANQLTQSTILRVR